MRYSSAVVLSTLAVGQAAAANVRHASFHARRQAEAKRGYEDVNWSEVSYDLSGVDWSSVFATPTPTPESAPSSVAAKEVVATSDTPAPTSEAAYTPTPTPSSTEEAPKPSETETSDSVGGFVTDLLQGVEDIVSKLGISGAGVNDKSSNGGLWVGDDGDWKTEFINDAAKDVVVFCWQANGFTGMTLNVNKPAISVGLKKGEKTVVSFAPNVPAACAPAFDDTTLANFGGIDNTWYEVTFGSTGAFDITRNVKMQGNSISAKGSKCTSDMDTCVFKCTGNVDSCETGYDLFNCSASNGGGGGYDPVMQGTGGGCSMGSSGEKVTVTFT